MSAEPINLTAPGVREALSHAAEMRLIGLCFERPRPGRAEAIRALAREVADATLRSVADRLAELEEEVHVSLFGPGGPVSPREVAYRGREDPGRVLADLAAFYRAFAFAPETEEPADHVAVEAGFVGYLWLKEAYALARGDATAAEVTATARARFLEGHLATLAAGLAERFRAVSAGDLQQLADALRERTGAGATAPAEHELDSETDMECEAGGESGEPCAPRPIAPARAPR